MERPRFYLQPGAVDCALLFWLNYKNTYEFWLQQKQQYAATSASDDTVLNDYTSSSSYNNNNAATTMPKQPPSNLLTLKLRVTGLGVALPLSKKKTRDFFKSNADCLVISLHETVIYACSSGCVVSKGQFNNFSLRFVENFNMSSSEWNPLHLLFPSQQQQQQQQQQQSSSASAAASPNANNSSSIQLQQQQQLMSTSPYYNKNLMNAWIVPSGNYEICSSTIEKSSKHRPSSLASRGVGESKLFITFFFILNMNKTAIKRGYVVDLYEKIRKIYFRGTDFFILDKRQLFQIS